MTDLVVDASVAASWLFDDEDSPSAALVRPLLRDQIGWVPQLWQFEIRNVLLIATRRGRLDASEFPGRLFALNHLPFTTDNLADLDVTAALGQKHGLTFYDALYLELALRRSAGLATLDRALLRAAMAEGVPVYGQGQ